MTKATRKHISAAYLLFASAALHFLALVLNFAERGFGLALGAGLLALLAMALLRESRLAAYLAFFTVIFGSSGAIAGQLGSSGITQILFTLILIANLAAAFVLFGLLWARPASKAL